MKTPAAENGSQAAGTSEAPQLPGKRAKGHGEARREADLWRTDIREFGVVVERESTTRLTLWELVSSKAPSIARPYCCYANTVIFYLYPHQLGRDGRHFLEWDRVDTLLMWEAAFLFEGHLYICGGGRVIRYRNGWWMKRWARRKPTQ